MRIADNLPQFIGELFQDTEKDKQRLLSNKEEYVYFIRQRRYIKIGRSRDWHARLQALQAATPYKLEPVMIIKTKDSVRLEKELHYRYRDYRVRGEWFKLSKNQIDELRRELENNYEIITFGDYEKEAKKFWRMIRTDKKLRAIWFGYDYRIKNAQSASESSFIFALALVSRGFSQLFALEMLKNYKFGICFVSNRQNEMEKNPQTLE